MHLLAWLGHRAIAALAAGAIVGVLVPQLAAFLQRILPELIFLFTILSLLTVNRRSILPPRGEWPLPWVMIIWSIVATPLLVGLILLIPVFPSGLSQAIMIWAVSPPMTAAIIFAKMLELDTSLALSVSTTSIMIVPVSGPLLYFCLAERSVRFNSLLIAGHVCVFITIALLATYLFARLFGSRRISRIVPQLNGCAVLILVAYSNALTSGVSEAFSRSPWRVTVFLLVAFSANLIVQCLTFCIFFKFGVKCRMTCALLAGNRNMSILCANLGSALTPDLMLFFAISHIPTYTLPWLFRRVYTSTMSGHGDNQCSH